MAATSQTTDQSAIDIRGLAEQVTAGVRRELEQVTAEVRREMADARKTIDGAAADARRAAREVAQELAADIERRINDRESRRYSSSTYRPTGRSQNPLARAEHDYEVAIETALKDLVTLATSNTRLWFRLQKFYIDLLDRSSRQSLDVQRRIYSDILREIATDILQEGATPLPTEHRVNPGETLSDIAIRYYGDPRETNWRKIYDANKEVIGGDPQAIRPGDPSRAGARLSIPA
jgi:nucleoid-associated protein YgaU